MTRSSTGSTSWIVALGLVAALAGSSLAQSPPAAAADAQPSAPAADSADARKACSAAMNADPQFALDVVKIASERAMKDPKFAAEVVKLGDEAAVKKRDADTVAAHVDANQKVQRNERHVIYGYAAMWIIAAAFVIFLWRRQRGLESEIAQLRRELDAASEPAKART